MNEKSLKERHKKMRILLRVLIVVSIVFAWGHSMIPATESSEESGFVLELLRPVLSVFFPEDMINGLFVRKLAHFCEYTLMGLEMSAYAALIICTNNVTFREETDKKTHRKQTLRLAINTVFCGLAVAFIDETIQIFSPGRGPEIADVWLDMGGFVCGGMIIVLISLIKVRCIKRKYQENISDGCT